MSILGKPTLFSLQGIEPSVDSLVAGKKIHTGKLIIKFV